MGRQRDGEVEKRKYRQMQRWRERKTKNHKIMETDNMETERQRDGKTDRGKQRDRQLGRNSNLAL
jgi:hypothetical protein